MVLDQKCSFFKLFFLGNIGQENVFYDIRKEKNAFLDYKNKKFKKWKNWHLPKGVNLWFWTKNGHFSNFVFRQYRRQNVFYNILKGKNACLGYKNKNFKKSKNWHFSKAVNPWFGPKMAIFPTFLFRQYRPGNCLLRYSRTKKRLSRLLKREVLESEKLTFFQRG